MTNSDGALPSQVHNGPPKKSEQVDNRLQGRLGGLAVMAGKRFRIAAAGLALLCAAGSASADQFYYSRTKAGGTATGDEGATELVRWDDATGAQTLLTTAMTHATDGRVSVAAVATNGATLYGLVVDDTSNATLVPFSDCTAATCRSRLVTINPANGVVTYVGGWLAGNYFSGAGFDPSGRLWVVDNLSGDTYRLDPASGAIVGAPIQTNVPALAQGDIDFTSNGLGIVGHSGFSFVTFDPDTGTIGAGSFSATNSGFDGSFTPPYALAGIAFTAHLAARNGSPAATTCRIDLVENRGLDELGHVNDPWSVAAPIARKEANQLDPPTLPAGYMNGGGGDMARVGGPAFPACILDFGDAPNTYATLLASNGARHQVGGPFLGSTGLPDIDINGVPNAAATGDDTTGTDDESGATVPALVRGATVPIQITVGGVSAGTRLQVWIDWGRDNSFTQAGDQVLTDAAVTSGANTFNIAVPATAVAGASYARFRISNAAGLSFNGVANSGEVEDHAVTIALPATVVLNKTTQQLAGGPFAFALTNTTQAAGTVTTTAGGTPAQVDGNTSVAGMQPFTVTSLGQAVSINESPLPEGSSLVSASCTNSGGTVVGSLSGTTYTIPAASVTAAQAFTCSFVNVAPQPSFGTCSSTMYLGVDAPTQLHSIDTSSNPLTYPPIGTPYSPGYNAMGYDPASNYIFATNWDTATSTYHLLRIASNGVVQDAGAISGGGINASGTGIASAEIGADGFYYVKHNASTNEMWRVNLSTRTATLVTLSQTIANGDLAWSNGLLYAQDHVTGLFHSINPTTGTVSTIGPSGFIGGADAFGSMIGASNGIFGRRNSGGFYKFDLATGQATLISDAPAGGGDGAKCVTSPVNFAADLAISKDDGSTTYTPGTNVTYSIVVSNNGPFGVQNAQVNDALPTGISSASWTCATTAGGAACGAASGSGAINTTANLPANGSVTYSLTLTVPSTFSGNLVNIATVTAPVGSPDSNTTNNRATDTDTQFPLPPANIANISCSSDPNLFNTAYDGADGRLPSGADTYWQVAFTTSPASNNTGTPPAGLSYGPATVVSDTATVSAWGGQKYANAAWVSHAANAAHADFADTYYRYQFNLGPGVDPAVFRLAAGWFSDNRVYRIYVNGLDQGVVDSGNGWTGASSGTLIGPWQSGANEIIVHVQSDPNAPNTQGVTAQFTPQPLCAPATLSLNKATTFVAGGPFGFSLTNTAQAAGTITTSAADTPAQVDGDTSSGGTVEPFTVSTFGADVVIAENSLPSGWLLNDAVCTSGGTPVGSRSGNAYTIPGDAIDASAENFVCTFTNAPTVNLRIDKTANPTALRTGDSVTYTIVLNNDGPGPGDGARFFDPAVAGVDCSAATLTCSAASGGAVCPTSPAVADLQGSGITIPTFPAGSSMQFTMACAVTASGAP